MRPVPKTAKEGMQRDMENQFERIQLLLGGKAMERLAASRVAVLF